MDVQHLVKADHDQVIHHIEKIAEQEGMRYKF
jgi:hypothetical protein